MLGLNAQSLEVLQDTFIKFSADTSVGNFSIETQVVNTISNRPLDVRWIRTAEHLSNPWTSQVCDINTCYPATIDSADFTLAAADTGIIDVYFNNQQTGGYGCVTVKLIENPGSNNEVMHTLVFYGSSGDSIVACKITGVADIADAASNIHIFPNPATDYIIVKRENNVNAKRVEVYNMLGIKVLSTGIDPVNSITRIELMDMQKGIYMIRVYDDENNVLVTKSFSKTR